MSLGGANGTHPADELLELLKLDQLEEGMRIFPLGASVPTGLSEKDVVWTRNKTTLYRYRPTTGTRHAVPVLLVYALINKPYIFDLRPDNSFVSHLLDEGYDVFLLDWGTPGWEDRGVTFDELIGEHLPKAVARMRRAGAGDEYTLFGYCMGGTIGAVFAALCPEGLRNLVALTTPIDFTKGGTYAVWTDPRHLDAERVAEALGNIPGDLIDVANKMLNPVTNLLGAQITMWQRLLAGRDMTSWLAMNKWVNDGVPFPGAAFVQWIRDFYQRNALMNGELVMAGERVDLRRIRASLLTIAGGNDHIVPPAMARPLAGLTSSADHAHIELPAGHVGLLAGSGARTSLWPKVTAWLDARSG
ncbi:MAG: PHA/PHB synthase family protein [Thermoleophilia bacterium]